LSGVILLHIQILLVATLWCVLIQSQILLHVCDNSECHMQHAGSCVLLSRQLDASVCVFVCFGGAAGMMLPAIVASWLLLHAL
jgi:hypothetical protein